MGFIEVVHFNEECVTTNFKNKKMQNGVFASLCEASAVRCVGGVLSAGEVLSFGLFLHTCASSLPSTDEAF